MVWCTYCGQEFSRAEHLDRHVMTHTNVKPYKCPTCHFSFKKRDLLQRHHNLVHKDNDRHCSDQGERGPQRRPIACVACARAKTKCDKQLPSCSRCTSKGLFCEARSTKRSNEAAYRLEKRQLSLYRRPISIAPSDSKMNTPPVLHFTAPCHFLTSNPVQSNLHRENSWTKDVPTSSLSPSYPTAPATILSMSSSDTLNEAHTSIILDGSDLDSHFVSTGQLYSSTSDSFYPNLEQYPGMPMAYSPESSLPLPFGGNGEYDYQKISGDKQNFPQGVNTSYATCPVSNNYEATILPVYQWDACIDSGFRTYTTPSSRPSSVDPSRYSRSFE